MIIPLITYFLYNTFTPTARQVVELVVGTSGVTGGHDGKIITRLCKRIQIYFHQALSAMHTAIAGHIITILLEDILYAFYSINPYIHITAGMKREISQNLAGVIFFLKENPRFQPEEFETKRVECLEGINSVLKEAGEYEWFKGDLENNEIPAAEYSLELQESILELDYKSLEEPVLDIGCGQDALLVLKMRDEHIDAYGIDRMAPRTGFLFRKDWLEYEFVPDYWGTIISHQGFSTHFIRHFLHKKGLFKEYGECYMRICRSLKKGGQFIYTPGLPFIEQWLPKEEFTLRKRPVTIEGVMPDVGLEVEGFTFPLYVATVIRN